MIEDGEDINISWIGRETQYTQLRNLIHPKCNHAIIHVYGGPATGKTGLVREICALQGLRHAYVPCLEITTMRELYEDILNQLARHQPSHENGHRVFVKCDRGVSSFFENFCDTLPYSHEEASVVVLDGLGHLAKGHNSIIAGLLCHPPRHRALVVVLISRGYAGMDSLGYLFAQKAVHPVHFPNYTAEQIKQILKCSHLSPSKIAKIKKQHYSSLMDYLVDMVATSTTNLLTCLRLKHAIDCAITQDSMAFTKCKNLITRLTSNIFIDDPCRQNEVREFAESEKFLSDMDRPWNIDQDLDLSFTAKYLALAAYLCAYNPQKTDIKYFGVEKILGKRKKRRDPTKKALRDRLPQKLIGSQVFSLERMLAVFHRIWDQNPPFSQYNTQADPQLVQKRCVPRKSSRLSSQVATLITLGILAKTSKDPIDETKLKCLLSHGYAQDLATSVGFPIAGYQFITGPL